MKADTAASPAAHDRGPLPLVVGVTGHRDLRADDGPALERLVRETLLEVQDRLPHTPLLVLSPLAEGSDQLVARVGLDLGARLVVPLPMPLDLYEQDFASAESRAAFRTLLAAAERVFELPLVEGNSPEGIASEGEERDRQYAQVGAFVARQSQVFLALWDGLGGGGDSKAGGTSDVVHFRLDGAPERHDAASPLEFANRGQVFHIVTPRRGRPESPTGALTRRLLLPKKQTAASFDELRDRMNEFNRDVVGLREMVLESHETSQAELLQVPVHEVEACRGTLSASARSTLTHYAIADTLALRFGAQTSRTSRRLFVWVFVAALFFNLYHSLPHPHLSDEAGFGEQLIALPWMLLLFLAASLLAKLWVHRQFKEADFQNKHQDYRALAEALRIQFFWQVGGVPEAVVDHYLRKQRGALEWIRQALRAWDTESVSNDRVHVLHEAERLEFVARHWVQEQRAYYASKARREQHTLEVEERRVEMLVRISVILAFVLALALTLPVFLRVDLLEEFRHVAENVWVHAGIMMAIVTLAVTAGLRHGYNHQMARSEHAKQFGRMAELFDAAEQHLRTLLEAGQHRRATTFLKELGAEALEESGDWVLLHRDRPLEVPHSG